MIYQDEIRCLFKEIVKQQKLIDRILEAHEERQKCFSQMIKVKVHHSLQDQWLNEDKAQFYEWLDKKRSFGFKSIPFEELLDQKAEGQFLAPVTTNIRPKKIVETAEEEPRPPVISVETESVVGLEEKVQVFKPKIDSKNDSSEECSNDEQDRYTALDEKNTSIDMVIGDIGLVGKTTPIDMIIGDKADMGKPVRLSCPS